MAARDLYNRLFEEMSEDGMILQYLPANQAYMVTFGSYDGPRIIGPSPLRVIVDWWQDMEYREEESQEATYDD